MQWNNHFVSTIYFGRERTQCIQLIAGERAYNDMPWTYAAGRLQEAGARADALLEQLQASTSAHAEALAEAEQVRIVVSTCEELLDTRPTGYRTLAHPQPYYSGPHLR